MKDIIKDIRYEIHEMVCDTKTVKKFGIIFSLILTVIGVWLWYKHSELWVWFAASGGLMMLTAFATTTLLIPLYKGMTILSIVIGYFVSRIILTIMFFILFAPIGLFMRLIRNDILDKKINRKLPSYWFKKEHTPFSKEKYERLF
ncbi:hypothetical protein F9K33_05875 [bacterium]|nr:MAG: hypothetical protein F9K33_05875 [bacterium]